MRISILQANLLRITFLVIILLSTNLYAFYAPTYYKTLLIFVFLYSALAISYDIMGGLLGYMNLGHIIYFGAGAYIFTIVANYLSKLWNEDLYPIIIIIGFLTAGVVVGAVAALLSYPLFRLKGFYFSVATLGLISFANILTSAPELSQFTGGFSGINIDTQLAHKSTPENSFFIALMALVISGLAHYSIRKTIVGTIFICIKEDEHVAEFTGINPFRYKQFGMIISATLASTAGSAYIWFQTYTNPRLVFSFEIAFLPVIISLFGGSGSLIGHLLAAIIFTIIYQIFIINLPFFSELAMGAILIATGLGASFGLSEFGKRLFSFLCKSA